MSIERTNPYEDAARERKAIALVVVIARLRPENGSLLVSRMLDGHDEFWLAASQAAGVHVPGRETRERVVALLAAGEEVSRRIGPIEQPADPFAEIG